MSAKKKDRRSGTSPGRTAATMLAQGDRTQPPAKSSADGPGAVLSTRWRWLLSGLLVLHLVAVVAEPFRFFTNSNRGTSPAADTPRNWLAPYIEFAYLNHGYFFFAPEPGPSHLLEFQFPDEDGSAKSVRYPDRRAQWPRLLYHRHFMLTENLHQLWVPPVDLQLQSATQPTREQAQLLDAWQQDRQRYERIRDSMVRHVSQRFGVDDVAMSRIEHVLLTPDEVHLRHTRLNDPSLYVVLPDVSNDPAAPPGGPMVIPGFNPDYGLPRAPQTLPGSTAEVINE